MEILVANGLPDGWRFQKPNREVYHQSQWAQDEWSCLLHAQAQDDVRAQKLLDSFKYQIRDGICEAWGSHRSGELSIMKRMKISGHIRGFMMNEEALCKDSVASHNSRGRMLKVIFQSYGWSSSWAITPDSWKEHETISFSRKSKPFFQQQDKCNVYDIWHQWRKFCIGRWIMVWFDTFSTTV